MSSRLMICCLLIATSLRLSCSNLNQHIQYIDTNGIFVWQSTSHFIPIQSQSFGNITIGHQMYMEFDFVWNGHITSTPTSGMFFRIGADAQSGGNTCDGNWNRFPSLFINDDVNPSLILYLSEDGSCSRSYDLSSFGVITADISYHVVIAFNMTTLYVSISEESLIPRYSKWSRSGTPSEYIGEVVPVWWMSNKFGSTDYNMANGTFSNITIRSKLVSNNYNDSNSSNITIPPSTTSIISDSNNSNLKNHSVATGTTTTISTSISTPNDNVMSITMSFTEWIIAAIVSMTGCLLLTVGSCCLFFCYLRCQSKQLEFDFALSPLSRTHPDHELDEVQALSPKPPSTISPAIDGIPTQSPSAIEIIIRNDILNGRMGNNFGDLLSPDVPGFDAEAMYNKSDDEKLSEEEKIMHTPGRERNDGIKINVFSPPLPELPKSPNSLTSTNVRPPSPSISVSVTVNPWKEGKKGDTFRLQKLKENKAFDQGTGGYVE